MVQYVQDGVTYNNLCEVLTEGQRNLINTLIEKNFVWPIECINYWIVQSSNSGQLEFYKKMPCRKAGRDFALKDRVSIPREVRANLPVLDGMVKYWHSGKITFEMFHRVKDALVDMEKNNVGKTIHVREIHVENKDVRELFTASKINPNQMILLNSDDYINPSNVFVYHADTVDNEFFILECIDSDIDHMIKRVIKLPKDKITLETYKPRSWFPECLYKILDSRIKYVCLDYIAEEPYVILSEKPLHLKSSYVKSWYAGNEKRSIATQGQFFDFFIQHISVKEFNKVLATMGVNDDNLIRVHRSKHHKDSLIELLRRG